MSDPRKYLLETLRPIAGDDGVYTVVEYISTFDKAAEGDMVQFLEETYGHRANFVEIIHTYCTKFVITPKAAPKVEQFPVLTSAPKKSNTTQTLHTNRKNSGKKQKVQTKGSQPAPRPDRRICGCFATHHDYVSSCRQCGRIHCSSEGVGSCLFCGEDLLLPCSAESIQEFFQGGNVDESTIAAYKQKDKLLLFDREHAKRTQVKDAQGDYYETSTWLTAEEKAAIDEKERARLDKYKRSGRQMKISFDIAGRKIVEDGKDDDEEDEEEDSSEIRGEADEYDATLGMQNLSLSGGADSKSAALYRALRDTVISGSSRSAQTSALASTTESSGASSSVTKIQHALEGGA